MQKTRLFFYVASRIHRQIERGNPDDSLAPVYVVCRANYSRKHVDPKRITKYTGLSAEELEALK